VKARYARIDLVFKAMAEAPMGEAQLRRYLRRVFPDPADSANSRGLARSAEQRRWSSYYFEHGRGQDLPGVKGTLWAAYNGVSEFVDHAVPARGGGGKPGSGRAVERSLESIWFGEGYLAKARAFREAEALVGISGRRG
jgi:hypothetical protein